MDSLTRFYHVYNWRETEKEQRQEQEQKARASKGDNILKKICAACGELKEHNARGLCRSCYQAWYREQPGVHEKHAEDEFIKQLIDEGSYTA